MKQGHMALFFFVLLCYCFFEVFSAQMQYRGVKDEKKRIEESLLYAVDAAAWKMTEVMEETTEVKLFMLEETFFSAWFTRIGISGNEEKQKESRMYIPLMVWLEEDGGYFYAVQETKNREEEGGAWSRKIPYALTDKDEENRKLVQAYLEKNVADMICEHNRIAKKYGMEYEFYIPYFLTDASQKLSFPILIVVFQGWPLGKDDFYENCIDANVYIRKKGRKNIEF